MDPANRSSTSPPFRLLDLPLELQRIIFGYALFTQSTLRRPTEAKYYGAVVFSGTNILRVSSQINKETLPIFYQVSHFHFEQLQEDLNYDSFDAQYLPLLFRRSLHMMRHISIDFIQRQPWGRECNWERLASLEDKILAQLLSQIREAAPNLRTLALHFAPLAFRHIESGHPIKHTTSPCLLVPTDRLVNSTLGRLSLVYFGEPTALEEFRSNIAPLENWTARTLESWPVTIRPTLIKYINEWREHPDSSSQIRIWDMCRHPRLHAEDQES